MSDLELASLDEIEQELQNRFEHVVLIVQRPTMTGTEDRLHLWYYGGISTSIGMMTYANSTLLDAMKNDPDVDDLDM